MLSPCPAAWTIPMKTAFTRAPGCPTSSTHRTTPISYEHDVYAGFAAESGEFSYDVGWLYYNYDAINEFDFHEIYGSIGWRNVSLGLNVLSGTEAEEVGAQDFGFGTTFYLSLEYTHAFASGAELTTHLGYHDGDFSEAFNGVPGGYVDYSVMLSVKDFTFMITDTDLPVSPQGDNLDNGSIKFVIGYSMAFDL
jgi:uncharacterized protein (TIGR02001 family)